VAWLSKDRACSTSRLIQARMRIDGEYYREDVLCPLTL
jgi:hypothetical protein